MPDALPNQDHQAASAPQWQITSVLRVTALALVLLGCFVVLQPFLTSLLWAVILCVSSFPVYARLLRVLRGRRTLAAAVMTLVIVLTLLAPFVLIGLRLADDVQSLMEASQKLLASKLPKLPAWVERLPLVGERLQKAWQHFSLDTAWLMIHLRQYIGPATSYLLIATGYFLKGLAELALSILLAFFLFRDGAAAAKRLLLTGERLAGNSGEQLITLAGNTIRSVVYGILGTALGQSIVAGIGFAIAGVPGAGFLTLLTFFLAVTPIGAPMVWIPAAIWLFLKAGVGWGIFMIVWGLIVSSIDNVIKPMIIGHGSDMPFILILLGVLGGAAAFGLIGVFLGPTLLAVALRLLKEWTAAQANEDLARAQKLDSERQLIPDVNVSIEMLSADKGR